MKNELVRFYLSVAILRMRKADAKADLLKVRALGDWEAQAFADFGKWPWGEQMFSLKVVSVTHDQLRDWQCELMKNNETFEVVHIHDGWDVPVVREATETARA